MDCNIFLLSFKSKQNKDHRKRAYNPNWMSFKPSVSFHKMKNLKKTTMISVLGIPFVEFKSITLHRAIRHFDSSRSNKVAEGRLKLPTYGFACKCSNQLSIQTFDQCRYLNSCKTLQLHHTFSFRITESDLAML